MASGRSEFVQVAGFATATPDHRSLRSTEATIRVYVVWINRGGNRSGLVWIAFVGSILRSSGCISETRHSLIQNKRRRASRVKDDIQRRTAGDGCRVARAGIRIDQRQISAAQIDGKRTHVVSNAVRALGKNIKKCGRPGRGTAAIDQEDAQGTQGRERYNSS